MRDWVEKYGGYSARPLARPVERKPINGTRYWNISYRGENDRGLVLAYHNRLVYFPWERLGEIEVKGETVVTNNGISVSDASGNFIRIESGRLAWKLGTDEGEKDGFTVWKKE